MDNKALNELYRFVIRHKLHAQSSVRMAALARMLVAYNNLVCMTAENDYDERDRIIRKIDALFDAVDCRDTGGLLLRYRLTKDVMLAVYGDRDVECGDAYRDIVGRFVTSVDRVGMTLDELDTMKCVVYELGNIFGDNTQFDYYPWFRERCEEWICGIGENGSWQSVDLAVAARRLGLLEDNRCVFNDCSFDDRMLSAYGYYKAEFERVFQSLNTHGDIGMLGAWADLLRMPGFLPCDTDLYDRVLGRMETIAGTVQPRSDIWYTAMSYVVEHRCLSIVGKAQEEMLRDIA